MFKESLFSISISQLQDVISHDWTIFNVSLTYVLGYVVYKVLGRYIYFKPQEHASKINRTFLSITIMVVTLHFLSKIVDLLPFLPEYRWLYGVCSVSILIGLLSILTNRMIWKYGKNDHKELRYQKYMPIQPDYHKTAVSKTATSGNWIREWEEEAVTSTKRNLHSDVLLNMVSLIIFTIIGIKWTYESVSIYGIYSTLFSIVVFAWISAIFIDSGIFSWIDYLGSKKRK